MLVLSRETNQSVVITAVGGQRIKVTVLEVRGHKVRLGFLAADDVEINREEVQDDIESGGRKRNNGETDGRDDDA